MVDSTAEDSTNEETVALESEAQEDLIDVHPQTRKGKTSDLVAAADRGREEKVLLGRRRKKESPPQKPVLDSLEEKKKVSSFESEDNGVVSSDMMAKITSALEKERDKFSESLHDKTTLMLQQCLFDSEEADAVTLDVIRPMIEQMKRFCIVECLLVMSQLSKQDIQDFGESVIRLIDAVHGECVEYRRYKGSFCREWREAVRDLMLIAHEENESEAPASESQSESTGDEIQKVASAEGEERKKKRSKRKRRRKRNRVSSSISVTSVQFNYLMPPSPLHDNRVVSLLQPYRKANDDVRRKGRSRTRFTLSYDMQAELGLLDEPQFNPRVMTDSSGLRKFIDSLGDTELKLLDDIELVKVS